MDKQLKKMGLWPSLAIYIPASLLLLVSTKFLIPFLSRTTGQEIIFCWFIVAGLGVFLPLVVTAAIILKHEGYHFFSMETWKNRLRFVKPGKLQRTNKRQARQIDRPDRKKPEFRRNRSNPQYAIVR